MKRSTNKLLVLLLLFFRKVLPPACHLERSPPEILPSLCSVLLRSSTPLRFAQNDTGGRSRNPKGERQRRSDLAGRLKPALRKSPRWCGFFFGDLSGNLLRLTRLPTRKRLSNVASPIHALIIWRKIFIFHSRERVRFRDGKNKKDTL